MEPYMKMAFMTCRTIVQAGMLPYWDDLLSSFLVWELNNSSMDFSLPQ